ncbi:AAA family ATPase [Streptomyces liliifuscus]|uniref:AAA family ATPase n=1 Tax=Streptomyces liliifuscus TaxID=2797636 RepID=A0A7T7RET6_9ACTN|nr:LuxR family transcriptional regulator [Streptomyces liliifuscus]QQM43994.1 AAA family ATPase [Streptomyces liliifuscus]
MEFVGRTDSLALLAATRERARAGHPQRVLVEGPAGIGKTALIRRFLRDDTHVLYGAGEEAESELAFGVLEQLLGRGGSGTGDGTGTGGGRWADAHAAGAALLEALDEAQGASGGSGSDGGAARDADAPGSDDRAVRGPGAPGSDDRAARGSGAPDTFVPATSAPDTPARDTRDTRDTPDTPAPGTPDTPVALVLDDAQWADHLSLQALAFAVRRLRADRVLVLVVVRDAEDTRLTAGLRRLFTADDAVRVRLDGLGPAELAELGGGLGVQGLTAQAAARLHAHTAGNPLHVKALLEQEGAGLLEALGEPDVTPPAPKSFTALVLAKLAACSTAADALVCAAAVLGTHCTAADAWEVAGADLLDEERGAADVLTALEEAVHTGLLTETPGDPVIRFPHPLVHAAVYHQLGPSRRAALHLSAARTVRDQAHRLRHRALAAAGPDPELAAELAALGRRFAAEGAWAIAAGQLTAAARLCPDPAVYEQYTLEAVECALLAGDVPDMGEVAQRIAQFTPGGWRSYLLGRLSLFDLDRAEALLTDAWHRCDPAAEPLLGARIAGQFAALHGSMSHGAEMAEWADLAIRLAPDDTATDMIRVLRLNGLAMSGRAPQTLDALGPLPDPALATPAQLEELLGRGTLREWTGDLTGAVRDLGGVFGACHGRAASFRVVAATALASAEYRAGRWDDAIVHTDLALSLAADTDQPHIALYCRMLAAQVHAVRGAFAKAQAHARVARVYAAGGHVNPALWAALAEAHLARAQGRPEEVLTALGPLLALAPRGDLEEPGTVPWADLLAEAWAALGDEKRAVQALAPYEVLATQRGHHGALLVAARARGTLEAARGDTVAAERAFRSGLKHAAHVEAPFDRALLHLAYGGFLRRAGRRTRAGEQLRTARDLLVRLDAPPDLGRCERELAACGLGPVGSAAEREPRTRGAALLTPQELAVARLVASGLTNRQVARELVISVKTVEYHLGRIFPKLGVDSRTRLTAALAADGPGSGRSESGHAP